MYTLTLVFDKKLSRVLMCFHEKFQKYNFIDLFRGRSVMDDFLMDRIE